MSNLRILLIEGDAQCARKLVSALEAAGHSTAVVGDCEQAAEALAIQRFDLVLLGSGLSTVALKDFVGEIRQASGTGRGESPRVLAYAPGCADSVAVDGVLPPDFDPAVLQPEARHPADSTHPASQEFLSVFEPEEFAEQCAEETSLMVEIIDLFEAERHEQLAAMANALSAGDLERLSRHAHTMKGSVGALHASRARESCQSLELAAKDRDHALCAQHLATLEANLNELAAPLASFRAICLQQ